MHKLLISIMVVFMLLAAPAMGAMMQPAPVFGKVINEGVLSGIEIRATNLFTDESLTTITDDKGYYIFEFANSDKGLYDGENVRLEIIGCSEPECISTHIFNGNFLNYDFDVIGVIEPVEPPCPPCDSCCPMCVACDSCCPVDPSCPPEANVENCASFCEDIVCDECPEPDANRSIEILLTALLSVGATAATVTLTLGKKAQHYHRGIRNKHSLLTRHRDATIRHPIGEAAPVYRKIDDKYVYIPEEER